MLQFYNDKQSQERNSKIDSINILLSSFQKLQQSWKRNQHLNVKILIFKKNTISKTEKKFQNIMNKIPFSNSIFKQIKSRDKDQNNDPIEKGKTPKITPKL